MSIIDHHIHRAMAWLRSYLGFASTAAVTYLVAWGASHGVTVDETWLQVVLVGLLGLLVGALEEGLVWLANRVERLGWVRVLVRIIRLGQPLPSYDRS